MLQLLCFTVPETSYEEELIPPSFTQKPKFQNVDEGTTVSFSAQVVATPKPDVSILSGPVGSMSPFGII